MPKVVHFELPFDDAARANKFYADIFGWESSKFDGQEEYYLQQTGGDDEPYGIGGALIERAAVRPEPCGNRRRLRPAPKS